MRHKMRLLSATICCVMMLAIAQPSNGVLYDFQTFTADGKTKAISGLDLSVDVTLVDESQIRFEFHNDGSTGIMTSIFFDRGVLADISGFDTGDQTGVNFRIGSHANNLAAHKIIDLDETFSVSAKPSRIKNGVGPGEWLAVIFDLQPGKTFTDLISEIDDGQLRMSTGVHGVPANLTTVNEVPEPATAAIIGLGFVLLRSVSKSAWRSLNF